MRNSSIRRRLLTAVMVTQLLLTVGLVLIAVMMTRRQLRTAFDAGLHGRAMSVAALVRYTEEANPTLVFDAEMVPPPLDAEHPDLYRILDSKGKVIAVSPNWPTGFEPTPREKRDYWDFTVQGHPYRAVGLLNVPVLDREGAEASNATLTVFYAATTGKLNAGILRAGVLISAASLLLLVIATGGAVWAIGHGLSPLGALAASAAAVSPSNWELHAPPESLHTSELVPLTQAIISALAKLRQAFTSQRVFLADAAHELKTPVAILKSTLQSLLQKPRSSEEYRSGIEAALEDTVRLEKLVHSMLRLARAEQLASGGIRRDLDEIDLTSTCELSVANLRPLAEAQGVRLELVPDGAPKLRADAEDMELIWRNLLENAIQHSSAQSTVIIRISRTGSSAQVEVQDHGPGIPDAQLARVFERFHRADTSRARSSGGYGLGLAISKAIVEAYGGNIAVTSNVGSGTTMTVRLPAIS